MKKWLLMTLLVMSGAHAQEKIFSPTSKFASIKTFLRNRLDCLISEKCSRAEELSVHYAIGAIFGLAITEHQLSQLIVNRGYGEAVVIYSVTQSILYRLLKFEGPPEDLPFRIINKYLYPAIKPIMQVITGALNLLTFASMSIALTTKEPKKLIPWLLNTLKGNVLCIWADRYCTKDQRNSFYFWLGYLSGVVGRKYLNLTFPVIPSVIHIPGI